MISPRLKPTSSANDRLHILGNHTFACGNVEAIRHLLGQGLNRDSKFAFFRSSLGAAFLLVTQAGGKKFGAVGHGGRGFLLLAVANESNRDLGARLARGDIGNQFIAVLHRLAVHGHNRVAHLQASLLRRTARGDI